MKPITESSRRNVSTLPVEVLRVLLPLLAVLITALSVPAGRLNAQVPADQDVHTNGDLNGDGTFDILDLAQLERAVFLNLSLSRPEIESCDVDGDWKLTTFDLLVIGDALKSVKNGRDMFSAVNSAISKDLTKDQNKTETYLDMARFYIKEGQLDLARRVLESIRESLDVNDPNYEALAKLLTRLDNEEEARRLMEEMTEDHGLFNASDDLGDKVSLRRMALDMQSRLSSMLKDSKYAAHYNSKRARAKLNAVMENMMHDIGKDKMVDPAVFSALKTDISNLLDNPDNLLSELPAEQRNRLFGVVDEATSSMRDEAMRISQENKDNKEKRAARSSAGRTGALDEEARLERSDWELGGLQRNEGLGRSRLIIANAPKTSPDTISIAISEAYTLEWDVSNVLGAKGTVLEISKANHKFQNPNGEVDDKENQMFYEPNKLSTLISGSSPGSALELEGPGVYQYRVAALNANKELISRFSDADELVVVYNNVKIKANTPVITPDVVTLDEPDYKFQWDVSNLEGAIDAYFETSYPGQEFSNPNGREIDEVNTYYSNSSLGGPSGKIETNVKGWPGPGAYLFRVIAKGPVGNFIGQWSDPATLTIEGDEQLAEGDTVSAGEDSLAAGETGQEKPAQAPDPPSVRMKDGAAVVSWDVNGIDGADKIVLEISPAGTRLSNQEINPGYSNTNDVYTNTHPGGKDSVSITGRDIKGVGVGDFLARIAAVNSTGAMFGLWSSPVKITLPRADSSPAQEKPAGQDTSSLSSGSAAVDSTAGPSEAESKSELNLDNNKRLRVKRNTCQLLDKHSLLSRVISTLKKGEVLIVLREHGNWYEVTIPGENKTGWVFTNNVEKIGE